VVQPGYLPDRDRRRLAGSGRSRAALPGQGPNCKHGVLSRVFSVKVQGLVVKIPILVSLQFSPEPYKIPRNSLKNHKNTKPILLGSRREIPPLLLFAHGWILNSFSLKNTNVKNSDLV
jgi:hypothetical protein